MSLTLEEVSKEIPCSECLHWSRHECLDSKGNNIARKESLAPEPFWYYELCKKNWGLPQNAYYNANNCKFFKQKK